MFTRYESIGVYIKRYPVTIVFLLACIGVFIGMAIVGSSTSIDTLLSFGALYTPFVESGEWYRLLTANFLHIGFLHLAMNMVFLYVFAPYVERFLGKGRYIAFLLLTGIGSMALPLFFEDHSVTAGASGILYGVLALYMYLFWKAPHAFAPSDKQTIWAMFAIGIVWSVFTPDVSMFGHAGGFVSGWILSVLFCRKKAIVG